MKEILEKLYNLIGICESRIKQNISEKSELASLRLNLTTQKEEQSEMGEYLKGENETLDRKKLICSTLAEAYAIKKKASEMANSIKSEKETLEKDQKSHNSKVANDNRETERQREKAAKERKGLESDKKTYKTEILAEIAKEQKIKDMKNKT